MYFYNMVGMKIKFNTSSLFSHLINNYKRKKGTKMFSLEKNSLTKKCVLLHSVVEKICWCYLMLLVFSITFIGFLLVKYVMFASSVILVNLLVMCLPFQFQTNNFPHFSVYCSRWYRYQKTYTPSFKQIFLRCKIINISK